MTTSASNFTASRLCSLCGLCCNGVIFRMVELQPDDSPRELARLGLRSKRRNRQQCILQPCPAHTESQCSIYAQRPTRCRLFECRQLKQIAAGEITESMATAAIHEAQEKAEMVRNLLLQSDGFEPHKALAKCYDNVLARPLGDHPDGTTLALRDQLTQAMNELQALLDQNFRVDP